MESSNTGEYLKVLFILVTHLFTLTQAFFNMLTSTEILKSQY